MAAPYEPVPAAAVPPPAEEEPTKAAAAPSVEPKSPVSTSPSEQKKVKRREGIRVLIKRKRGSRNRPKKEGKRKAKRREGRSGKLVIQGRRMKLIVMNDNYLVVIVCFLCCLLIFSVQPRPGAHYLWFVFCFHIRLLHPLPLSCWLIIPLLFRLSNSSALLSVSLLASSEIIAVCVFSFLPSCSCLSPSFSV